MPKPRKTSDQSTPTTLSGLLGVTLNAYSEDKFYTAASNGQGTERAHLQVWMPQTLMLRAMKARERVPAYDSLADLMRDALYHRLQWLETNYDAEADWLTPADRANAVLDQATSDALDFLVLASKMNEAIAKYREIGDPLLLGRLITDMETHADEIGGKVGAGLRGQVREARKVLSEMER